MKNLTPDQQAIIATNADIAINAVAGSGKTTTIIEYAAARPPDSKILYIAFNRSVKLEAIRRFKEKGLLNVRVETAHSLAYSFIIRDANYRVKRQGYKIAEIVETLNLPNDGSKHTEYIIANHINKFITYFCNSEKEKVTDLNYLDTITEPQAKMFVGSFYKHIESWTRKMLSMMDKGEIEITHDFYLKKFQLSNPHLEYDYILFDEGQDASVSMLDVFLKQKSIRVIVGDTHQQIYGWRHAVNSMAKTDFPTLDLSVSFRFHQDIANLATSILEWKAHLGRHKTVSITGSGSSTGNQTKATIARTNVGLLVSAITFITDNRQAKHIYFEGNINSYTYAEDGASLYDVLNLSKGRHDRIRDKLIQSMKDIRELEDYVKSTEDIQLGMMIEIVNEYGDEIHELLKTLKRMHTGDEERDKAEMIFSTVHRAKGMEYDIVHLVGDFMTESMLKKTIEEAKREKLPLNIRKLNEEINLIYVAITRTKHQVHIHEALMPAGFPESPYIHITRNISALDRRLMALQDDTHGHEFSSRKSRNRSRGKPHIADKRKPVTKSAQQPWTSEMDEELKQLFESDNPIGAIATHFNRTKGAIITRLRRLDYFND